MSHQLNVSRIKGVYNALIAYKDEIAFVGGATISLYADAPEQTDTRPTDDIDILVEIVTYSAYSQLQEKLAALGFEPDSSSKIICRYKYQGLTVDIMPLHEDVLGFTNKWYREGFANHVVYQVDEMVSINIFSATYFIASKFEAFKGRGESDGRTSKDFEDIVFVLDNRKNIWEELNASATDVKAYLKEAFAELLELPYLEEWIAAHLEPVTASKRSSMLIDKMRAFSNG